MKKKTLAIAAILGGVTHAAWADTNVKLYGLIDVGLGYSSNQTTLGSTTPGRSKVYMANGVWQGSRWGLTGSEDLGGDTQAVFLLESSFNPATGAVLPSNAIFGRRSYVGLSNTRLGALTIGRQYTSYYTLLAPLGPISWVTGYVGAHAGDIDSFNSGYRPDKAVLYVSPEVHGLVASGTYAFPGAAGVAGNNGSTWSAGLRYTSGPLSIGSAFLRINNSTPGGGAWGADSTTNSGGKESGLSSLTYGYRNNAAQDRAAIAALWKFSEALDLSLTYSNVQYIPGVNSGFRNTAIFNSGGAVLHWKPTQPWDLGFGYSETHATAANGITDPARYRQVNFTAYYGLSKNIGVFLSQGYQRANGKTYALSASGVGSAVDATASIGDGQNSTPSSTGTQFVSVLNIIYRF